MYVFFFSPLFSLCNITFHTLRVWVCFRSQDRSASISISICIMCKCFWLEMFFFLRFWLYITINGGKKEDKLLDTSQPRFICGCQHLFIRTHTRTPYTFITLCCLFCCCCFLLCSIVLFDARGNNLSNELFGLFSKYFPLYE